MMLPSLFTFGDVFSLPWKLGKLSLQSSNLFSKFTCTCGRISFDWIKSIVWNFSVTWDTFFYHFIIYSLLIRLLDVKLLSLKLNSYRSSCPSVLSNFSCGTFRIWIGLAARPREHILQWHNTFANVVASITSNLTFPQAHAPLCDRSVLEYLNILERVNSLSILKIVTIKSNYFSNKVFTRFFFSN